MKKFVIAVIALFIMATLGASAAYVVKPDTINSVFDTDNETNWTTSWDRGSNGTVVIDKKANVDGHTYRITIEGSDDNVYRVTMTGWYADMEMLDGGMFSEGLYIYNDLSYICFEFLPGEGDLYSVFNSYDIYYAVKEGSRYFDETFDNWMLLPTEPGRLAMRNGSCLMEAQRTSDGWFQYTVTF